MLQILLAADDKLQRSIVGPLEARGCAVRAVRGLSQVARACEQDPRPDVVAAALPVTAGGAKAIGELRASAKGKLPPLLILLPPNRGTEIPRLKAAGAAEVFESPLKINTFVERAQTLAARGREQPRAKRAPVVRRKAVTEPDGQLLWPRHISSLEECGDAIEAFKSSGTVQVGFEQETLEALFRAMTDLEVRALKELPEAVRPGEEGTFVRVARHRLRVRQATGEADRLVAGGATISVDEAALAGWLGQLNDLSADVQSRHQEASTGGQEPDVRSLQVMIDAIGRMQRDLQGVAERVRVLPVAEAGESEVQPEVQEIVHREVSAETDLETSPTQDLSRKKRQRMVMGASAAGLLLLISLILWALGVFARL